MISEEGNEIDRLLEVTGVTRRKAEGLLEEYGNLYTVSWAVTHDGEYVQSEFKIDPEFLRSEMMEAGIWRYRTVEAIGTTKPNPAKNRRIGPNTLKGDARPWMKPDSIRHATNQTSTKD